MKAKLIYDAECPLCSRYVRMVRLREHVDLTLIDARFPSPELTAALNEGYEIDKGMVLHLDNATYHGEAAISALALLTTPSSAFNRINILLFRSPAVAKRLYPVLVFGRGLLLRFLGRKRLGY